MPKISETLMLAGGNFARATKFSILLTPPNELSQISGKTFDVLAQEVQIPDINMEAIDIILKGHTVKIPGRVQQDQTITVTFLLDEYHILRKLFADWIGAMDDRYYGTKSPEASNLYKSNNKFGNMIVATRDFEESTNQPMNYIFEGIFPTNVSGPAFNASGVNEILEFTVTFAYYRFLNKSNIQEEYDDVDEFLEKFGLASIGNLSSFNFLKSTIRSVSKTWNNLQNIGNTVTDLFTKGL